MTETHDNVHCRSGICARSSQFDWAHTNEIKHDIHAR